MGPRQSEPPPNADLTNDRRNLETPGKTSFREAAFMCMRPSPGSRMTSARSVPTTSTPTTMPTASLQVPVLPGGGVVRALCSTVSSARQLSVFEQHLDDGRAFRWLCSSRLHAADVADTAAEGWDAELIVETVVQLSTRSQVRNTRSAAVAFCRSTLLPEYHRAMAAALGLCAIPLRTMLFLGVGGGALPCFLAQHHPRSVLTCVEADGSTLALARDYFGCVPGPRMRLHGCTADAFLRRCPRARFSAVFIDLTGPLGTAPPQAWANTSVFRRIRSRLRHGGLICINVLAPADGASPSHHLAAVTSAFVGAFGGASSWLLQTSEGNAVMASLVGGHGVNHCGREARENASAQKHLKAWLAGTAALGFEVSRLMPMPPR